MNLSHLPNAISVLRLLLVPPVVWALLEERYPLALMLFAIAGASDGIDGFLAKRFGWTSRLGAVLDPLADKVLVAACYLALGWLGYLPLWLTALVIGRDLLIVGGAVAYHLSIERVDMAPTLVSKFNTAAQLSLVIVVLISLAGPFAPDSTLIQALIYLVLGTTLASGAQYVWAWGRRARQRRRRQA